MAGKKKKVGKAKGKPKKLSPKALGTGMAGKAGSAIQERNQKMKKFLDSL